MRSVRAVDPDAIAAVAAWAAGAACPLHAHLSEQPAENAACEAAYGVSPTRLLADAGALGPAFTAVHATHLSDADISLLGGAGCCCCFCPTTERDLADDVGYDDLFVSAGASLALGSDSHAVIDPFEEARAVELDERLASQVRGGHPVDALLRAATEHGHDSLGWRDAGRLAVGCLADLVTVDLSSVRTAGTSPEHALATAVHAASAADVRHVVVGGRVIVRDGQHVAIDVARELASSVASVWRAVG